MGKKRAGTPGREVSSSLSLLLFLFSFSFCAGGGEIIVRISSLLLFASEQPHPQEEARGRGGVEVSTSTPVWVQLVYLLAEAAEIEHGLMCCYLYAAYSLKGPAAQDLSAEEKAAVGRWRSAIVDIAIDEMLHLSLVSNLLAAASSPRTAAPRTTGGRQT